MDECTSALGDDRTIGHRLRRIRIVRGKSLAVIAGLAGISESHLSRLESGEHALDRLSLIVALADALQIAPSELTSLPIPAPANGHTDSAIGAVRHALMAINHGHGGGQAQPVDVLRERVNGLVRAACRCEYEQVGAGLPGIMRDLHAGIGTGRDVAELLDLAVLLHTQGTVAWLRTTGAPLDLCSQAAMLAARAAEDRGTPTALGLATASTARVMIVAGAFDLAQAELDSVTVPLTTPESMQLAGFRAMRQTVVAAADSRPGDMAAPLQYAAELAARTGEGNAFHLAFGPFNIGLYAMAGAIEIGDNGQAVSIAEGLQPDAADTARQAYFWVDYGRALARLRGRWDDAVHALRRAELIYPHSVQRNPFAREILAELLTRVKRDVVGRELRAMAYRAGLLV